MKHLRIVFCLLIIASLLLTCGCSAGEIEELLEKVKPTQTTEPPVTTEPVATTLPVETEPQPMNPADLAEYVSERTVTINVEGENGYSSVGSGFFIDDQGTLVTCYHVIDAAESISVHVSDGGNYDVSKIVDFSVLHDIAILKVDLTGNPYLEVCRDGWRTGETVYAVGSSLGFLEGTFSNGIISSASRSVGMINCVQTTAAISPGNSGGPLVNEFAEVVGINAFSYVNGDGLNLAISISQLDEMEMNRNWNINQFREWYKKEIGRSYSIWNYGTEEWELSMVNTYQHVTGRKCEVSDYDWAFTDGDFETMVEGYHDFYGVYGYKYYVQEFDLYTEYLNSIGFSFLETEEFTSGISYYYENEFTGENVDIFILEGQEYIFIEVYK